MSIATILILDGSTSARQKNPCYKAEAGMTSHSIECWETPVRTGGLRTYLNTIRVLLTIYYYLSPNIIITRWCYYWKLGEFLRADPWETPHKDMCFPHSDPAGVDGSCRVCALSIIFTSDPMVSPIGSHAGERRNQQLRKNRKIKREGEP